MKRALVMLALAGVTACTQPSAKDYGEQLFTDPTFSGSQFNHWSCATCHATKAGDTRLLSGHSLADSAGRPSYWGGNEPRFIDAASFCYVYFMRGPKPFAPDEPRSRALYEYLKSISPSETSESKPFTIVLTAADVPRGDAAAGQKVYESACQDCHGELHTGAGRNSPLASILPEVQDDYSSLFPGIAPSVVFVEKIRHGQFFGVGGNMPLFGTEMLSDEQLGALLTFLGL